jgi:DNA-binding beta-propeller fold protein YncE
VAGLTAPAGNCSAGYFCAAGSRNALGVGVNPVGVVTPFAGLGVSTFADGTGSTFNFPISVVMDPVRNFVYVSDNLNHRVRRVDMTSGAISVLAGTGSCYFSDGMGNASGLCYPVGLSVDALGNYLYIADSNNYRVRRVDLSSGFMSTVAGNGGYGYSDGNSSQAMFSSFSALVVDANSSRLFIADTNNYRIRSLKLSTGQVSTLAGNSMQGSNDGIGTQAMFGVILSIALDPTSSFLLFTDGYTKIRMLTLSTLAVTTLSSSGVFQSNPGSIYSMNFFSVILIRVDWCTSVIPVALYSSPLPVPLFEVLLSRARVPRPSHS